MKFCMSASAGKLRPRSLRSGLSALGSGDQSFEEGSHLKKQNKNKSSMWYNYLGNQWKQIVHVMT